MIVETIRPDVAIITDVCHDTNTPMINKIKQGDLKCGDGNYKLWTFSSKQPFKTNC